MKNLKPLIILLLLLFNCSSDDDNNPPVQSEIVCIEPFNEEQLIIFSEQSEQNISTEISIEQNLIIDNITITIDEVDCDDIICVMSFKELYVSFESSTGELSYVTLMDEISGFQTVCLSNLTFDDMAAVSANNAVSQFGCFPNITNSTYRPSGSLSSLKNLNAKGTWRLTLYDPNYDAPNDMQSSIEKWSMEICGR